jgi:hypothetical protein
MRTPGLLRQRPNTTTIPPRDTLATLPLPTAIKQTLNTGTHLECYASNLLPFCDYPITIPSAANQPAANQPTAMTCYDDL